MTPYISFHQVASIALSPIDEFPSGDGQRRVATRDIIVTDKDGKEFRIMLFAQDGKASALWDAHEKHEEDIRLRREEAENEARDERACADMDRFGGAI